ncbi:MAG: hypothetical protein RSC43_00045 [Clostridia bacterium]
MDKIKELYETRKREYDQAKIAEGILANSLREANARVAQLVVELKDELAQCTSEKLKEEITGIISRCDKLSFTTEEIAEVQTYLEDAVVRITTELERVLNGASTSSN